MLGLIIKYLSIK